MSAEIITDSAEVNHKNPVKNAIIIMINLMRIDYHEQFDKRFKPVAGKEVTDDELWQYKKRIYVEVKACYPSAIVEGYRLAAKNSPDFIPKVQNIIAAIEAADKEHKKAEERRIEAERVSALPPPTITCDPVQMFVEAKAKQNGIPTRAEMDARIENHRALLVIHGDKIRSIKPNGDQLCKHGMCNNAGTMSRSTKGDSNFYCVDHFRQSL